MGRDPPGAVDLAFEKTLSKPSHTLRTRDQRQRVERTQRTFELQVVAGGEEGGLPGAQKRAALIHTGPTLLAQPWPSIAVDYIVNAAVGWLEAAEALLIRRVDDGIDSQLADVAPPNGQLCRRASNAEPERGR